MAGQPHPWNLLSDQSPLKSPFTAHFLLAIASGVPDTLGMQVTHSLANQFLIAMPGLADPNFAHTVTFLFEHSTEGARGIIINRPTKMHLSQVFHQLQLTCSDPEVETQVVLQGGPVHIEQGFVIHHGDQSDGQWEYSAQISDRLRITTSRDILAAMARGEGPTTALVALGYAGWEAGQLETEIQSNSWLTVPADDGVMFTLPYEERWDAAMRLLGVDASRLGIEAGHA
jgi:putative transcriptional regulator